MNNKSITSKGIEADNILLNLEIFILSAVFGIFLFAAYKIIMFGYPYGYMDDWVLYGAERLIKGLPLYLDPSISHPVVDIYPAGFIAIFSPVVAIFGINHLVAHFTVFMALIAAGIFIFLLLRQQGLYIRYAILFTLLFFSTYFTITNQMLLLIMPGAFTLLVLTAMLYFLFKWESEKKEKYFFLMCLIFWFGCYVKQTVILYGISVLAYLLIKKYYKTALLLFGLSSVVVGGVFLIGNYITGGMWYEYFIKIPSLQPYDLQKINILITRFFKRGLLLVAACFVLWKFGLNRIKKIIPEVIFLLIIAPYSVLAFIRQGGGNNQFIEISLLLILIAGRLTAASFGYPNGYKNRIAILVCIMIYIAANFIFFPIKLQYPGVEAKNSARDISQLVKDIAPDSALAHCYASFIYKNSDADFINTGLAGNFYVTKKYDINNIKKNLENGYYDILLLIKEYKLPFIVESLNKHYYLYHSYKYTFGKHIDFYCRNNIKPQK